MSKIKKECVAMLLAGGQGTRLGVLTADIAKPAVPFGGKYRIIDFPLSNCINSGIDTVGVLTQYMPLELNEYIGSGQPWDLDRLNGGVHILPPYVKGKAGEWYKGTANAVFQNIKFLERYDPEYVLILSGDHIYKMDYSKMLEAHKQNNADCTIAALQVPLKEASRFGIMNTNEDGQIYEFEEKPEFPKSNNASMGVYIFTWEKLRNYLVKDEKDKKSSNDFGKNVLPAMLGAGERMFSYSFDGYWKDVGTIDSLWEANMDLLNPKVPLRLYDPKWKIYSRNPCVPPQFIGEGAQIKNSLITEGSLIFGTINNSVLFSSTFVGKGAVVNESIVMPGAIIEEGAIINYSIIAEDAVIKSGVCLGCAKVSYNSDGERDIIVVGRNEIISGEDK